MMQIEDFNNPFANACKIEIERLHGHALDVQKRMENAQKAGNDYLVEQCIRMNERINKRILKIRELWEMD